MLRIFLSLLLFFNSILGMDQLQFSLFKKGKVEKDTNTILVIGGIQGDEPGGFNAASLLATKYSIKKGAVWVVPNLNFNSIINRSRGLNGDMNRKFSYIKKSDPDYKAVKAIKELIKHESVDLILNLHDGSGFYRKKYIDKKRNPYRWGQSIIIDQTHLNSYKFSNLEQLANKVIFSVNQKLIDPDHKFTVKNTHTKHKNKEMAKTLTYFAIKAKKPAFGIEGSKDFLTYMRAYYHLLAVESYMKLAGIKFERHFKLNPKAIKKAINQDIKVVLEDKLPLLVNANTRNILRYVPLRKDKSIIVKSENPLVAFVNKGSHYRLAYGNRRISKISPQYFDFDNSLKSIPLQVDGANINANIGSMINVEEFLLIHKYKDYRFNLIGFTNKSKDETGIKIYKNDIIKRYSIDKQAKIFRLEAYKGKKFSGMVLIKFGKNNFNKVSQTTKSNKAKTGVNL